MSDVFITVLFAFLYKCLNPNVFPKAEISEYRSATECTLIMYI